MSIIKDVLEIFAGRVRLHLSFDGKPAIDVVLTPGEVLIEIMNPLIALEMGINQLVKGSDNNFNSYVLKMVKATGYKVKVKYKVLEFEL
jgi:hypothetical protein